jgi:hypothetical protein
MPSPPRRGHVFRPTSACSRGEREGMPPDFQTVRLESLTYNYISIISHPYSGVHPSGERSPEAMLAHTN